MLLLLLAVPSVTGVLADKRLRHSLDDFNDLVHQAHERSLAEHRPYLIVFGAKSIAVRPEIVLKSDSPAPIAELPVAKSDAVKLTLPAALTKTPPPSEWIFWSTGTCEPAVVRFSGRNGGWTAKYSPLTATPELMSYAAR